MHLIVPCVLGQVESSFPLEKNQPPILQASLESVFPLL